MKTDEIREKYLDFFQQKEHRLCPSDVLVPTWDHSVLFTPAGMNQFKDHFLGKVELEFVRATSCQKCLRTGDIENVGRTAYHHTFFEMLGNFSFGDYFKRDAIRWAWEFLTDSKWLGLNPDQLTVSVYLDDDEAFGIWQNDIGLTSDRISRLDEYENFWPAGAPTDGPDGVCGPCSEIFFHPEDGSPEVEIWNLVFTQFNRIGDPPDNLSPLPSKNIDTGMGLERIAATMQGVTTNYHIDTLRPIVEAAAEICGVTYQPESEDGRRLRRITDHIRACTFSIHENVYPGPQKEKYVIRRLLRRGVLDGHQMGLRDPFLYKLVPAVVQAMSRPYPELGETSERVADEIRKEEEKFLGTLDDGLNRIERIFESIKSQGKNIVSGKDAAELYQTYGVPAELFEQIARNQDCDFDWDGYHAAMKKHSGDSGTYADTVMGDVGPIDQIKREVKSTLFVGYETTSSASTVVGLIESKRQGGSASEHRAATITVANGGNDDAQPTQLVVLDQTPFYAESGGQVGDTGTIVGPKGRFEVTDCQKKGNVFVHLGRLIEGEINEDDNVTASVDTQRRDAIRRAHSATHILHHSLQKNLGAHAQQQGSKVSDDWLRFDFTNLEAIKPDVLSKIESDSNARVKSNEPITATILPLAEAKQQGAMMLFSEKYPDPVRMVSMGDFSKELCGGTHLSNTGEIETFEIIREDNVSAGTRRIEALTGEKARDNQLKTRETVEQTGKRLNVDHPALIVSRIKQLILQIRDLKKHVSAGTKPVIADPENEAAPSYVASYEEIRESLRTSARELNCQLFEVPRRISAMQSEVKKLTQQLDQASSAGTLDVDTMIESAGLVSDVRVIVHEVPGGNPNVMRQLIDRIRKKTSPVAVFLAAITGEEKVLLIAGVSRDLVDKGVSAGDWVKHVAPIVGGGGGGKPDLAQAGGKQPENIKQALNAAIDYMHGAVVS